jgi:predicted secreted acid phosphatase
MCSHSGETRALVGGNAYMAHRRLLSGDFPVSRIGQLNRLYMLASALVCTAVLAQTAGTSQPPQTTTAPAVTAAPSAVRGASACGTVVLNKYHNSGKYLRNIAQTVELGQLRLEEQLAALPVGARPAVIFDIDETLLSTWPILESGEFCFDPDRFAAFLDRADAPVIEPVRELFNRTVAKHATVFLITSRNEKHRPATLINLKTAGIVGYQELIMQPDDPAVIGHEYKRAARQTIVDRGYEIVMSVGDQLGDLANRPGCYDLLIPNPFYTTE